MSSIMPARARNEDPALEPDRRPRQILRGTIGRFLPHSLQGSLYFLLAIVLVPIVLHQAVHYYRAVGIQQAQKLQVNLELARALAATFDVYVQDILRQEMSIGMAFGSTEPPSVEYANQLLLLSAREYPAIRYYAWANPQGKIVASSLVETIGTAISDRSYFQEVVEGREWAVSDALLGPRDGEATFAIARGIRDEEGTLQGVVLGLVDSKRLGQVLGAGRSGQEAVAIIDKQGYAVYRYPEVEMPWGQRNWIEAQSFVARALMGEDVMGSFVDIGGQERMAAFVPIDSIGWVASASVLKEEVMAPIVQDMLREAGVLLLVAISAFAIALTLSRNLLRRAEEIAVREEQLTRSRDFHLTLFDELPTPIRRSGRDGMCNYFNKSWLAFTGRSVEQEMGDGWAEGIHPDDVSQYVQTYYDAFKVRQPFEIEYRLRRHDGEYRWIVETGRPFDDLDGNFAGYIASCYDITDRKQQEEQLAYLATHDPLTGLPNRRSLEEAMRRVVARARRGTISALLFLDVDNFKFVNDTLGHAVGDHVLITLAKLLQEQLRTEDLLARLGGDEFAVLLEGIDIKDGWAVAERMRQAVEEFCMNLDGISFNLSISIGMVAIDGQESTAAALSQADAAMYRAKEQGRNRIVIY